MSSISICCIVTSNSEVSPSAYQCFHSHAQSSKRDDGNDTFHIAMCHRSRHRSHVYFLNTQLISGSIPFSSLFFLCVLTVCIHAVTYLVVTLTFIHPHNCDMALLFLLTLLQRNRRIVYLVPNYQSICAKH